MYTMLCIAYCICNKQSFNSYHNFLVTITFRVIPVPIPNTEVKPKCAENTCGLPYWEDRLLPDFIYIPR